MTPRRSSAAFDAMRRDIGEFRKRLFIPGARGVVRCDTALADFQIRDFAAWDLAFHAMLAGKQPRPAKFFIERTKGAAKSSDFAIEVLGLAAASDRMLLVQVAADDEGQASEPYRAAKKILRLPENRWLAQILKVQDNKIVNPRTGTTIEVLTRDASYRAGGAHGSFPDVLCIDELVHIANWEHVETLIDNFSKNPHGILCCLTNSGFLETEAHKLREVARQSPDWYFSALTVPAPWLDQKQIEERRRTSTPARFNRLWRGVWCSDSGDALPPEDIDAAITLAGPASGSDAQSPAVAGLDVGLKHDASAITVLRANRRMKRVELDHTDSWKATHGSEVDLRVLLSNIREIHHRLQIRTWYVDPWQSAMLMQLMRAEGMQVQETPFTSGNLDKMAAALVEVFQSRSIALYDDPDLIADIRGFQLEERGKYWRLVAPRNERGHSDRGVSFTLCLPGCLELLKHQAAGDLAPSSAFVPASGSARGVNLHSDCEHKHGIPFQGPGQSGGWTSHGKLPGWSNT